MTDKAGSDVSKRSLPHPKLYFGFDLPRLEQRALISPSHPSITTIFVLRTGIDQELGATYDESQRSYAINATIQASLSLVRCPSPRPFC
jgi:hypothetical protein